MSAAEQRAARKDMARIERRLERITAEQEKLHEDLATNATDHEQVGVLSEKLRTLHAERDELEAAWLEAAEAVE